MVRKISCGISVEYTFATSLKYKLHLLKIVCDTINYYFCYISYFLLLLNILHLYYITFTLASTVSVTAT